MDVEMPKQETYDLLLNVSIGKCFYEGPDAYMVIALNYKFESMNEVKGVTTVVRLNDGQSFLFDSKMLVRPKELMVIERVIEKVRA